MLKLLWKRLCLLVVYAAFIGPLIMGPAWAASAPKPRQITWDDLLLDGKYGDLEKGVLEDENQLSGISYDPKFFPVNPKLNGKYIKLPGYVVPLAFDQDTAVSEFMLAPFLGACIHVPPPPPNQLIYVTTKKPVEVEDLYRPVWVIGRLTTVSKDSELAYAGYTLMADKISLYKGKQ